MALAVPAPACQYSPSTSSLVSRAATRERVLCGVSVEIWGVPTNDHGKSESAKSVHGGEGDRKRVKSVNSECV